LLLFLSIVSSFNETSSAGGFWQQAYDASKVEFQPLGEVEEAEAPEVIELVSSSSRPVRKPLSKEGVLDADILAALENSDGEECNSGDELEDEFVIVASVAEEGQASGMVEDPTTTRGSRQADGRACQKQEREEDYDNEEVSDDEDDDEPRVVADRPTTERPTRLLDYQFETVNTSTVALHV
jgi:hypothetical protein